jgi:hypothetical protein
VIGFMGTEIKCSRLGEEGRVGGTTRRISVGWMIWKSWLSLLLSRDLSLDEVALGKSTPKCHSRQCWDSRMRWSLAQMPGAKATDKTPLACGICPLAPFAIQNSKRCGV